jgi:hypothetical protein
VPFPDGLYPIANAGLPHKTCHVDTVQDWSLSNSQKRFIVIATRDNKCFVSTKGSSDE